jgi:hypothetical protein
LTPTRTPQWPPARLSHDASARNASSIAQRPIGTISPDSSATGMNALGGISRPPSSVQRASASNATIRPLERWTIG